MTTIPDPGCGGLVRAHRDASPDRLDHGPAARIPRHTQAARREHEREGDEDAPVGFALACRRHGQRLLHSYGDQRGHAS
jgi:hypothetical protein